MKLSRTAEAVLAALALISLQQRALAQEDGLQTIVVTAQKRAQVMQNVPVAVNTIDAKTIENQQIVDFRDLARVSPSMTLSENPNNSAISLRGVGTIAFSFGIESAVAVVVDDVPVIQQMQAFSNLSDLERMEVLRGPQGTLFGKNSSAGLINVVTRASSAELERSVQLTTTSDGERRLDASISGPLSERSGFRINAYGNQRRGDINNLTYDSTLNGERSRGVRARLDFFKPADEFWGRIIADYNARRIEGPVTTLLYVPPGARQQNVAPLEPTLAGVTPGPDNRNVRIDDPGYSDSRGSSVSAALNWKLPGHTLTSVTTYQDWKFDIEADYDFTDVDLQSVLTRNALRGGVRHGGPYDAHMLTQELRLTSSGEQALNYLGGLYFSDSSTGRSFLRGPTVAVSRWDGNSKNRTLAAFAQADYRLAPATRLSAGLRYNHERIEADFSNKVPATPLHYNGGNTDDVVTGKLALQQDLAKAVMAYASFATGYKGAGFDVSSGFDQSRIDNYIRPETSKAYELGLKSRFLNNRLQLNATLFSTDYDNFQAQSRRLDPVTNLIQNAVANVGQLRTRGLELEVAAKPVNTLLLEGSLAWVDATIRSYPSAICYPGQTLAQGCRPLGNSSVQDLAGKRLANAPRLKYTLGATYNTPLTESGYRGIFNLNYQHQSEVNYDLSVNPLTIQRAYGVLNGSVAVTDPSSQIKVTFYVNNLLDKSYNSFVADNFNFYSGAHVLSQTLSRNSQRYVGLRVKYEF
ncbi:TonB-dependent receptor [Duganella sp. P38]|uniref:TonB-dependent receptor n=1 Tax=Duganella sp. P38 TaxID=3423949 RepID=UPI003D79A128